MFSANTMMSRLVLSAGIALIVCAATCFAEQQDPLRFSFPDYCRDSSTLPFEAVTAYHVARDTMEKAASTGHALTSAEASDIRETFRRLASLENSPTIATYAKRRLLILNWQTGKSDAANVADSLFAIADSLESSQSAFTIAMALTIEAWAQNFDRFRKRFSRLRPIDTPQFGWFVSEFSRYIIRDYVTAGASQEETLSGQSIAEEYRRSSAVAEFLETQYFPAIEKYLDRKNGVSEDSNAITKLAAAQMALAMEQTTQYIREVLARRIYLNISERTTSSILPKSIELWKEAVKLLEASNSQLESPKHHRQKIELFQASLLPHLKQLQEAKHLRLELGNEMVHRKTADGYYTAVIVFTLLAVSLIATIVIIRRLCTTRRQA